MTGTQAAAPRYAELHCTSNFSFLQGASHPEEIVQRARALGYEAVAITDRGTLAGIVRAHAAAKETLDTDHPFCTHRFATDGRHMLQQEIEEAGDRRFTDIVTNQREFDSIVTPFLRELEFDGGVLRWWPLGRDHAVVLDPDRSLGQPIVATGGVQTRILSNSVKANDESIEVVARWFEVAVEEVRDAVEFEKSLLAA
jgi:uncharacterized protein (DUF433 family)